MHACADRIIDLFSGKADGPQSQEEGLLSNPARLCYVAKQALREGAVGKFLVNIVACPGMCMCCSTH